MPMIAALDVVQPVVEIGSHHGPVERLSDTSSRPAAVRAYTTSRGRMARKPSAVFRSAISSS